MAPSLSTELGQLDQDLVAGGWKWLRYDVPRHDDSDWSANPPNIQQVREIISSNYFATVGTPDQVEAAFLIGHVPVPYSGCVPPDGHGPGTPIDHTGASPADAYYGAVADMDWPDDITCANVDIAINSNYPGDKKWDVDNLTHLEVAIGRVDFANLSLFPDEVQDLKNYLNKDHAYRYKLLAWQSGVPEGQEKAIVYGQFLDDWSQPRVGDNGPIYEDAIRDSSACFGDAPGRLVVGDFFLQHTKSYLLGFQSGPGFWDRINWSDGFLEHKSADFLVATNEPVAAFSALLASYNGDWNGADNNLLRSMLTTTQYNLATMWHLRTAYTWRLDYCAQGYPLGECSKAMFNSIPTGPNTGSRMLTILGDPTLLVFVLSPPSNPVGSRNGSQIDLSWQSGDPAAQFLIYRSVSTDGPFDRLTTVPVTGTSYADPSPLQGTNVYLVRAVKLRTVGSGSYTNISEGAVAVAP